jgi:hypothetical protein
MTTNDHQMTINYARQRKLRTSVQITPEKYYTAISRFTLLNYKVIFNQGAGNQLQLTSLSASSPTRQLSNTPSHKK